MTAGAPVDLLHDFRSCPLAVEEADDLPVDVLELMVLHRHRVLAERGALVGRAVPRREGFGGLFQARRGEELSGSERGAHGRRGQILFQTQRTGARKIAAITGTRTVEIFAFPCMPVFSRPSEFSIRTSATMKRSLSSCRTCVPGRVTVPRKRRVGYGLSLIATRSPV